MAGTLDKHAPASADLTHGADHAVVSYNPDAPSEEWGWHGHWSDFAPRGRFLLMGLGVVGLLLMLLGNHVSHVEDWYLLLFAVGLGAWMVLTQMQRRRARRRKP